MLKIAVCEDESWFCTKIRTVIEGYLMERKLAYSVDVFKSGEDLLNIGKRVQAYNILFLDIKLKKHNGIDIANELKGYLTNTFVVLVTIHHDYLIEGYKVNARRYILKGSNTFNQGIEESIDAYLTENKQQSISLRFDFVGGRKGIYIRDILYIESKSPVLLFTHVKEKQPALKLYGKLDDIEEELVRYKFIRIHQSYLVNSAEIERIKNYKVTLRTGSLLPIAKEKYNSVKRAFLSYQGVI